MNDINELDKLKEIVRGHLTEKRYEHTLRVVEEGVKLGRLNKLDESDMKRVEIGAILHDILKFKGRKELLKICKGDNLKVDESNEAVLHSYGGSIYVRDNLGIDDSQILDGIRYHTTGRAGMGVVEKIIYIADAIEPGREYNGVDEIRKKTYEDLDEGILLEVEKKIRFLQSKGIKIEKDTLNLRDDIVNKRRKI